MLGGSPPSKKLDKLLMKRHEALSVGEIINQAIAQTGNRIQYERQQVVYLWAEAVGPTINRYTIRRYVEGDVLHVQMSSASLKSELSYQSERLVAVLNQMVGKTVITKIVFH